MVDGELKACFIELANGLRETGNPELIERAKELTALYIRDDEPLNPDVLACRAVINKLVDMKDLPPQLVEEVKKCDEKLKKREREDPLQQLKEKHERESSKPSA